MQEAEANTSVVIQRLQSRFPKLSDEWIASIALSVSPFVDFQTHVAFNHRLAGSLRLVRAVNEEYIEPGASIQLNNRDEVRICVVDRLRNVLNMDCSHST
eukprot:SAG31_NODE_440_length_15664_cov_8.209252_8_plen_100_part_00